MLKNIRYYAVVLLAAISLAAACKSDAKGNFGNVDEVADASNNELPKATEIGASRAGASFNIRTPTRDESQPWLMNFRSNYTTAQPEMNLALNDSLRLNIPGIINEPIPQTEVTFTFTIPNSRIDSLLGLQSLSNSRFLMSERKLRANISPRIRFTDHNLMVVEDASLDFSRCRRIYENDTIFKGVSVAGTFSMRGKATDTIAFTISSGRFDLIFNYFDGTIFNYQEK
jgi:hypothetical protein